MNHSEANHPEGMQGSSRTSRSVPPVLKCLRGSKPKGDVDSSQLRRQIKVLIVALALSISIGCNGLKKRHGSDFVKPLAASPTERKQRRQPIPDERTLCMETAKTVAEQGHAREAIKLYQRAEELGVSHDPLDKQLAPLHAQAGDFDAAINRYQRLITTSPNDTGLCNNFAWTLMEDKRYGEAITEANRGLAIDRDNNRLRTTLAMIHYRQGNQSSALTEFAKSQDATTAHHNLAVLDIDAGNIRSAKEHLRLASEVAAGNPCKPHRQTEALLTALQQQSVKQQPVRR